MQHLSAVRPARAIFLGSVALLLSGCSMLPSSAPKPPPPASATLPDATIAYTLTGQGALPVVFQSGLGDGKDVWDGVVPEVAKNHRVLAYDRPGYGASQKTTTPRDPCTIAAQQRALLAQAGLKPPYILVGQGLGGLYQYVYARLYPQDVAGLILLDPTHPQQWQRMQTDATTYAMLLKTRRKLMFNSTETAEFDAQAQCLQHIDLKTPLRARPCCWCATSSASRKWGPTRAWCGPRKKTGSACWAPPPSSASPAPAITSRRTIR